jgi:hypothetical protein
LGKQQVEHLKAGNSHSYKWPFHSYESIAAEQSQSYLLSNGTLFQVLTKLCTCRTPSFVEQLIETESGLGEVMKPPEKSFWAKYVSTVTNIVLFNFFIVSTWLGKFFAYPLYLTVASCFAVDVHNSSWSYCHECCHGSSKHTGGASWRAGSTCSTKGANCCSKEKMMTSFLYASHVIGTLCG